MINVIFLEKFYEKYLWIFYLFLKIVATLSQTWRGSIRWPLSQTWNANTAQWLWAANSLGFFSTKSAHSSLVKIRAPTASPIDPSVWKNLWTSKIHQRHRVLWWRILNNCLPTREILGARVGLQDTSCCLCDESSVESLSHVLLSCEFAYQIWSNTPIGYLFSDPNLSLESFCVRLPNRDRNSHELGNKSLLLASISLDHIWKARNEKLHGGSPLAHMVYESIFKSFEDYHNALTYSIKSLENFHS